MTDDRRFAPATLRNRQPLLEVLRRVLPATGRVLEIGSGTGEHAVFFADALPTLTWQPTEPDRESRASIAAWIAATGVRNVCEPLALDAASDWPDLAADAILAVNVVHIAPWSVAQGLMRGAGRVLPPGGPLVLYGPYKRDGRHTAPSNEAFDADLRARNPDWGVRNLEDVAALAAASGLHLDEVVQMPANNLTVVFRRA